MGRLHSTSTNAIGGCFECNGSDAIWTGRNSVACAARHCDATGHETWADQTMSIKYRPAGRRALQEGGGE